MNKDLEEVFQQIREKMEFRTFTVAIFRLMTSKKPVLILETEKKAKLLKKLLPFLVEKSSLCTFNPKFSPPILSRREYKKHWKVYSGYEICFVEEETTVINPGISILIDILQESSHGRDVDDSSEKFPPSFEKLRQKICRITHATAKIRNKVVEKKEKGQHIGIEELQKIFKENLHSELEKMLVFHIFKLLEENLYEVIDKREEELFAEKLVKLFWSEDKKKFLAFRNKANLHSPMKKVDEIKGDVEKYFRNAIDQEILKNTDTRYYWGNAIKEGFGEQFYRDSTFQNIEKREEFLTYIKNSLIVEPMK